MRKTNKNLTKQILTLMLAFVMVFTGMGIGSWGMDTAWANDTPTVPITVADDVGDCAVTLTPASGYKLNVGTPYELEIKIPIYRVQVSRLTDFISISTNDSSVVAITKVQFTRDYTG